MLRGEWFLVISLVNSISNGIDQKRKFFNMNYCCRICVKHTRLFGWNFVCMSLKTLSCCAVHKNSFLPGLSFDGHLVTGKHMTGRNSLTTLSTDEYKEKRKYKICVEGNIGCGKTTFLEYFSKFPFTEVIKEPVDKWRNIKGFNALEIMYSDPARYGLTFQTYVQLTMLDNHMQAQKKKIKMMERSIYSAKYCFVENLHKSGKMPEIEYIILTEWFDFLVKNQDLSVDLIVYIQTKPETVFERIKQRCRSEEISIPLVYLQHLHSLHEDWLINKQFPLPAPVLVLNGDHEKEDMVKEYESHSKEILQGITLQCGYNYMS